MILKEEADIFAACVEENKKSNNQRLTLADGNPMQCNYGWILDSREEVARMDVHYTDKHSLSYLRL